MLHTTRNLPVLPVILVIALTPCFLFACSGNHSKKNAVVQDPQETASDSTGYQRISAETAHKMMQDLKTYILLDVRTPEEFQEKHIEGAILIPVTEISVRAETELPNKNADIFVYCRSGARSTTAGMILADKGYTHVYNFGGIGDWPYGTVGGN